MRPVPALVAALPDLTQNDLQETTSVMLKLSHERPPGPGVGRVKGLVRVERGGGVGRPEPGQQRSVHSQIR